MAPYLFGKVLHFRFETAAYNDGSVGSDGWGTYDPPYIAMPAGIIQVGKKWSLRSNFKESRNNLTGWVDIQGKVVAKETVQVQAGTFETFKIQLDFMYQSGHRRTNYLWFDPNIGPAVKMREEWVSPNGNKSISLRDLTKRTAAK